MTVTIRIPEDLLPVTPRDGSQRAEAGDEDPPGRPKNPRGRVFQFLIDQFLIIGFTFATIFAYIWPNVAATGGPIRSEYTILYGSVAVIFLISGLQLAPDKLRENLFNWRLHIIVQGISFVIIPAIWLAIMWTIIAAGDLRTNVIDIPVLLGMLVTSCLPTTIASNIVMTRNAGGDDAAAIIEVVIGNVFGSFLCPGLIYVLIPDRPAFRPWLPASLGTLGSMYASVAQKLGLAVILPLVVGQTTRVLFKKRVKWCVERLHLGKVSTFFLCTLVWSTFSNAFKTGAIYQLPKGSIIFNILMNIGLYALFTAICFVLARPPHALVKRAMGSRLASRSLPRRARHLLTPRQMSKRQAVAVCFCGAAKTTSVGIPLVAAMWAGQTEQKRALLQIPVLLYTMEQVFLAQGLVYVFKWYMKRSAHSDLDAASLRARRAAAAGVDELDGAAGAEGGGGGGVMMLALGREAALRGQGFEDVKL